MSFAGGECGTVVDAIHMEILILLAQVCSPPFQFLNQLLERWSQKAWAALLVVWCYSDGKLFFCIQSWLQIKVLQAHKLSGRRQAHWPRRAKWHGHIVGDGRILVCKETTPFIVRLAILPDITASKKWRVYCGVSQAGKICCREYITKTISMTELACNFIHETSFTAWVAIFLSSLASCARDHDALSF